MQHIMTHTNNNCVYLQSAEIFNNANVCIKDKEGVEMINQKMVKTNYISIETKLPKGDYLLIVEELGKIWKRHIYI